MRQFLSVCCLFGWLALHQAPAKTPPMDSLRQRLRQSAPTDTLRVQWLVGLGMMHHAAQRPDSSLLYVTKALQTAQNQQNIRMQIQAYGMLGFLHSYNRNDTAAYRMFKTGIALAERHPQYKDASAQICMTACAFLGRVGQSDKALDYGLRALTYYKAAKDTTNWIGTINNIGIAFHGIALYDSSIVYYHQLIYLAKLKKNIPKLLSGYTNIGQGYIQLKKLDSAKYYLLLADTLAQQTHQQGILVRNRMSLADLLTQQQRYAEALQLYQSIEQQAAALSPYDHMLCVLHIGIAEKALGQPAAALAHLRQAFAFASEQKVYPMQVLAAPELADLYEQQGNHREANHYLRAWKAASDTILNADRLSAIGQLRTKFEIQQQQERIDLLQRKAAAEKRTASANRTIAWLLLAGLILALAGAAVIYRGSRKRRRLNGQLSAQKQALETVNGTQQRLFSLLSHDLRSPLNSVFSALTLLREHSLTADTAGLVGMSARRMQSTLLLLDNLLSWSAGQLNGIRLAPEPFYLYDIANDTIFFTEDIANEKNIIIENLVDEDIMLFADKTAVIAILRNLLFNALKFTPAQGRIQIGLAHADDTHATFFVRDTGIGIPPERLQTLWHAGNTTRGTANEPGTGLGLTLCKHLTDAHKGTIWAESTVNVGTTFFVQLPRA